jgi:FtsZ-interacting cell division protein ZipA
MDEITQTTPKRVGIGSTVGTIIIIALIVLGGLYFWGKRLEESKNLQQVTTEDTQTTAPQLSAEEQENNLIKNTNPSDELNSIEADLNGTNLDNLAPELQTTQ